jgi:NAD(P)-dependent dehydrogenase (short-subunit alcohol dehydrogenase family)
VVAKNILIIGANSSIGWGFVNQFLGQLDINKIYATYRQKNNAVSLINLQSKHPDKLSCLPVDITDEQQIYELVRQIQSETKEIHLVINCVGILHTSQIYPEKSLKHINSDNLLYYFQVNAIAYVLWAKHLLPLFKHSQQSIFACLSAKVGSISDNRLGGWYGYRASKAALNMFIKNVAIEYTRVSPQTIVVALHPGTTDTNLSRPFQKNVPPEKLFSVERCVNQLLEVINSLTLNNSGDFLAWDGEKLPW